MKSFDAGSPSTLSNVQFHVLSPADDSNRVTSASPPGSSVVPIRKPGWTATNPEGHGVDESVIDPGPGVLTVVGPCVYGLVIVHPTVWPLTASERRPRQGSARSSCASPRDSGVNSNR